MKSSFLSLLVFLIFVSLSGSAQNIAINNDASAPHPSAMLDINHPYKGLLVPRVALTGTTDVLTIVAPATSLLIYNIQSIADVTPGYYYWSSTAWLRLASGTLSGTGWLHTGNAGTVDGTNFIGTTDNIPFNIRVNNQKAGRIDNTLNNTFLGYLAGNANTTGTNITANGAFALYSNTIGNSNTGNGASALTSNTTGSNNTANGVDALRSNTTGDNNTASGTGALSSNTAESNNTANGAYALSRNTSGGYNTANGAFALYSNTMGSSSTANGASALTSNTTGVGNTANGYRALYLNTTGNNNTASGYSAVSRNTIGSDNTANGESALFFNTTGNSNTSNGVSALRSNTTGNGNTANGLNALISNITGNDNTAVGSGADVLTTNLTNATAIGANAIVNASNSLVLGGTGANAVKVGIGVSSPIVTLHVKGTANFFSGANTHTGDFYAGTSNVDGIEMVSSGTDAYVSIQRASNYALHISKPNVNTNNGLAGFFVNGVNVGSITTTGLATAYNTTSDARLKENVTGTSFGLSTLMKINVADYNYISDSKKVLQTGFVAQELFKTYPQAVQAGGENAKTNPWMIDYSKLTPLLVKSIQDEHAIIQAQEKRINEQDAQIKIMKEQIDTLLKIYSKKINP